MSRCISRRAWLRAAGMLLAAVPLDAVLRSAGAATNAQLRAQLRYQDGPKDGQRCAACLEYIPGKDGQARGGCKLIPGDDGISPDGWCTAFNTL